MGSHMQCALEICPVLNASLACVPDEKTSQLLSRIYGADTGWIGLYQDPGALGAEDGWDSWTSGCNAGFRMWSEGEPKWEMGSCAGMHSRGWFDAPCGAEMPCICEYGVVTTDEYPSDPGHSAWLAARLAEDQHCWLERSAGKSSKGVPSYNRTVGGGIFRTSRARAPCQSCQ